MREATRRERREVTVARARQQGRRALERAPREPGFSLTRDLRLHVAGQPGILAGVAAGGRDPEPGEVVIPAVAV